LLQLGLGIGTWETRETQLHGPGLGLSERLSGLAGWAREGKKGGMSEVHGPLGREPEKEKVWAALDFKHVHTIRLFVFLFFCIYLRNIYIYTIFLKNNRYSTEYPCYMLGPPPLLKNETCQN